jgi:hypothetical protein
MHRHNTQKYIFHLDEVWVVNGRNGVNKCNGDFSLTDTQMKVTCELLAHIGRNGIAFWYGQVAADGRVYGGPCVGRSDRICLPAHPTDDAVRDGLLQEDGWRLQNGCRAASLLQDCIEFTFRSFSAVEDSFPTSSRIGGSCHPSRSDIYLAS